MAGRYEERTSGLADGDTLLFASDGFAELTGPGGQQLGYDGVVATFRRAAQARTAQEIIERLLAEAAAFRATHPQEDDITFVAVRVSS
jgi:serine phosphatase RsbU (regulator of sigma subunit)